MTYLLVIRLLVSYFSAEPLGAGVLLLVYWGMSLPLLGNELAHVVHQYPLQRNLLSRILEPLMSPDDSAGDVLPDARTPAQSSAVAVAVSFTAVTVKAGGYTILDDITFDIIPGQHVAVVGRSGAGKSSLVGILLGWHRPAAGRVRVDGEELAPDRGKQAVALAELTGFLTPIVAGADRQSLDEILAELKLSPRQYTRLSDALIRERIGSKPVKGLWLLRRPVGGDFSQEMASAGLKRVLAAALVVTGCHYLFWLAS